MIIDHKVRVVVEGGTPNPHYFTSTQTDVVDETAKEPGLEGSVHRDFVILDSTIPNVPTAQINTPSDLDVRVNVGTAIVNDETTIAAHASLTKTVQFSILRDDGTGALEILAREKTTGEYAAIAAGKTLEQHIKEVQVVASGTVLTEV